MSVQRPEDSLVWFPITYFTFSFAVFPSVLSTATTLLWPSRSFQEPRAWSHVRTFSLLPVYLEHSSPDNHRKPLPPIRRLYHLLREVSSCLSSYPHACNASFSSLLSFSPWNLSHSNATKHRQPNCCLLSSFSPQWNVNSTRQGFLVVLFSADSQHLGIYLKHDRFPINIEYFLNEWMNKWDHRGNKMMLRKEEWITKAGRERPNVSVWSHLCKSFFFYSLVVQVWAKWLRKWLWLFKS